MVNMLYTLGSHRWLCNEILMQLLFDIFVVEGRQ